MTIKEKIQKKAEGYGKLAPAFLEGANFALENMIEGMIPCMFMNLWMVNHSELGRNRHGYFVLDC